MTWRSGGAALAVPFTTGFVLRGAQVLDFAPPGKRGKKAVPSAVVKQIEEKKTKRFV
jgi:hypothetical protein